MEMFGKFMKKAVSVEKFEEVWHAVVSACGLDGAKWVGMMFGRRHMCAKTLLRGTFL